MKIALLAWFGIALALLAVFAARAWRIQRRRAVDFKDTDAFVLGAEAWCQAHPDALLPQPTAAPTPAIAPEIRCRIEAYAIAAAHADFKGGRRRRSNPHARHSRLFALWAITYDAAWIDLELAFHDCNVTAP